MKTPYALSLKNLRSHPRFQRWAANPFVSVAGGSAVGQLILGASLPFVARIFTPAQIGVFGIHLAAGQVLCILMTGRLEQILPRLGLGQRWAVVKIGLGVSIGVATAAGVLTVALAPDDELREWATVILLVLSLSLLNIGTFALLAVQNYRGLASLRISNGIVTALASIGGGLLYPEVWMLTLGYGVGNLVAAVGSLKALRQIRSSRAYGVIDVVLDARLGRFAMNAGLGAALSNVGLMLPLIGAALLFGEHVAGAFFLARRVLMVPTQLVAASVSDVSYALVAGQGVDRIAKMFYRVCRSFALPSVLLLLGGLTISPLAAAAVGDGYSYFAETMALLTLPAVLQMVATSFSNLLLALHLEFVRTLWNLGRLFGLVLVYLWADNFGSGYLATLTAYSMWLCVAYVGLLGVTWQGVRIRNRTATCG